MNVTELARRLKITTKELLDILPEVGFDVGKRAIKIDDRQAHKIIQSWTRLMAEYKEKTQTEEVIEKKEALPQEKKKVAIAQSITVKNFAEKLGIPISKVMGELMKNGVLSSMNELIDYDTAAIVGEELGFEIAEDNISAKQEDEVSEKLETLLAESDKTKSIPRPPVVVVMGHVDHGKTKLLDTIRTANVVDSESGGITQHIGAYQATRKGKLITFIDTPGHEAFATMRSRGARVADIAILIIAADDSIQPQTKESIKIIKSAGLPMIVAINKIDKPNANQDKVKQDLTAMNLVPEEYGGKTICVPISAKQGTGIDDLLEMILLLAETKADEITANPEKLAVGTIVESHVDKGEGPVATVLIQNGTLKKGDNVTSSDTFYGKIRAMKDFKGQDLEFAGPSTPVKILGLKAAPSVGDILQVTADVDKKSRIKKYQLQEQATSYSKPVEKRKENEEVKMLNVIVKADVLGSLEAIISSLTKIEHPEVCVSIIAKGLGNITEADIRRAEPSSALVLGFHVKTTADAADLAKDKKVEIKSYEVIYHLIEEIRKRLEELLTPDVIRTDLGRLKVLAIFNKEKDSVVIGGKVTKGKVVNGAKADVIKGKTVLAKGEIVQLQTNKVDVNQVEMGTECGIKFQGKPAVEVDDVLEVYTEEVKIKKLDS